MFSLDLYPISWCQFCWAGTCHRLAYSGVAVATFDSKIKNVLSKLTKTILMMTDMKKRFEGVNMAGTGSKREGKFRCKLCRMVFDSNEELKLHLTEDHTEK